MIIIKRESDLEGLRASGRIAARIRDAVAKVVGPGVTTQELADYAAELMKGFGAESAFLGYRGYPGVICVSLNEVVVHGIPGKERIKLGDIVSLDIGIKYGGYIGDTALTVMVGVTDENVIRLVKTTEQALKAGIKAAVAGGRLGDISSAIQGVAEGAGYSVVRQFVGHGIGKTMHEDPQVPNFGTSGKGPKLKPGMTLAIEPMVNTGDADVEIDSDGWTVRAKDGKPSAHFEHSIAIREGEAEILTV